MAGKETPRQKLVKLMYLVFLSLMALNVDVSVLDSFVRVDDGLAQTNANFASKVDLVYADFDQQKAISEDLVYPYYDRAMYVREITDSLLKTVNRMRAEMMAAADRGLEVEEADTMNLIDLQNKDNYSPTTRYWMVENVEGGADVSAGSEGSRSYELREKIEDYKEELKAQLDTSHQQYLKIGLDTEGPFYTEDGTEINWQHAMFNRIPPVACATNLSRLITDIRNAEFDVISLLYDAITADDWRFDQIEARVVPQSEIVMTGEHYEADVFVAAYDSRQQPRIVLDGGREVPTEDGVGKLRIPATSEGTSQFSGIIEITSPAGLVQEYPFEGEYVVQRPSVTVSADAMNVFYAGVDNPVSISAPGIPQDNIDASISHGSIIPRGGSQYTVNVPGDIDEANINVMARVAGTTQSMGTQTFRIRTIPDPEPTIAGQAGGRIDRGRLVVNPVLAATVPDDFDFDMDFEIASFTMYTTVSGMYWERSAEGSRLTDDMIDQIERLSRGTRVTFTDITTRPADDGVVRELETISITITR